MNTQIIRSQPDLALWLQTPAGQYLAQWESAQFDLVVSDVFGYHGLQLGLPQLACLRNSRIRHCWVAQDQVNGFDGKSGLPGLYANSVALPFADQSLDLVVLPHTLELSLDPHATLREVERVLVPEGRVIISGFNPLSLWGQRQKRAQWYARLGMDNYFLPKEVDFIGYWRLRDWLRLLSFEVEGGRFGCYLPSVQSPRWITRFGWMDKAGDRWWPIFGAVYFLAAVKRVRGMRLLQPVWKHAKPSSVSAVPSVNSGKSSAPTAMHSHTDEST
jgi:SAM-dependent methyltransferase